MKPVAPCRNGLSNDPTHTRWIDLLDLDDGVKSQHRFVVPLLKELGFGGISRLRACAFSRTRRAI